MNSENKNNNQQDSNISNNSAINDVTQESTNTDKQATTQKSIDLDTQAAPKSETLAERIVRQQKELEEHQNSLDDKIAYDTKDLKIPDQKQVPEHFDEDQLSDKAKELLANLNENKLESIDTFGGSVVDSNTEAAIKILNNVQTKQTAALGAQLTSLSMALKDVPDTGDHPNLLSRLFHKAKMDIVKKQTEYQKAGTTINNIADELKQKVAMLDENNNDMKAMYYDRIKYYQSLTDYIAAGEVKEQHLLEMDIPRAKMAMDGKTGQEKFDTELKYKSLVNYQNRLSKRVYDLRSAQSLAYAQVIQLQEMAMSNVKLIDTIHTSISMAIPIWYEQATMYLFLQQQKQAKDANQLIIDYTNKAIQENSLQISNQMVEITKASETPVIKIETLQQNYQNILNGVKNSQAILDSSEKDREAKTRQLIKMSDDFHKQIKESLSTDRTNQMLSNLKEVSGKN